MSVIIEDISLVVFNPDGWVCQIIHGAMDLFDPAWNPDGHLTVAINREDYDLCEDSDHLDLMQKCLDIVNGVNSQQSEQQSSQQSNQSQESMDNEDPDVDIISNIQSNIEILQAAHDAEAGGG